MKEERRLKGLCSTLANNYIRSDESMKAQARVKDRGRHTFIDKVKIRIVDSDYWAEVVNFGHKNVHVPEHYVRDFERLVMGGVWAQLDMRFEYDEDSKGKNPDMRRGDGKRALEIPTPRKAFEMTMDGHRRQIHDNRGTAWLVP